MMWNTHTHASPWAIKLSNYQVQFAVAWAVGATSAWNSSQLVIELKRVANEAFLDLLSSGFANIFECVCVVQSALSAMHLSRLHSSTRAPVTASVLLRRSSSRRLLPSPQEATAPTPERRPSVIGTIPETIATERRVTFRRRNVMSLVGKNKNSVNDFNYARSKKVNENVHRVKSISE